jgi:hypothetical protein
MKLVQVLVSVTNFCEHIVEYSGSFKGGEFLDQVSANFLRNNPQHRVSYITNLLSGAQSFFKNKLIVAEVINNFPTFYETFKVLYHVHILNLHLCS